MRGSNFFLIGFVFSSFVALSFSPRSMVKSDAEYPAPLIREQRRVLVNGVAEIWTLKWRSRPKPACAPDELSITCPCGGFAYGESGDVDLIRTRDDVVVDRFHITPLFQQLPMADIAGALLQRWKPDYDRDLDLVEEPNFAAVVAKRPVVRIMDFQDYNHDGQSTEFYLQTETLPCEKSAGIVIGVSKDNPVLHVFGTALNPGRPLMMKKFEWEALPGASGPVRLTDWHCGDHGSETTTVVELSSSATGVDGNRLTYACTADDKPGQLISKEPL
jgi:hypothetical protein